MRAGTFSAADCVQHLNAAGVLSKSESLRPGEPDALRLGVISRRTDEHTLLQVVECLSEYVREQS